MVNADGCGALMGLSGLPPAALHRFVVGRDPAPVAIPPGNGLDDPFAALLAAGPPPTTAIEVVDGLKAATGARERSFMVGEGSQIPVDEMAFGRRTMRFLIALSDPLVDVLVSTFSPGSPSVEVMAWDATTAGFNYYRTMADGGWVFGGNSVDAVREGSEGNGPFESHTSGSLLMKELRFPWVHWHSRFAQVDPAIFAGHPSLEGHRWVRPLGTGDGTLAGADVCELEVAIPSIERWTEARFEALRAGNEPLRPRRIFEQVLTSPTVNLVSSPTKSADVAAGKAVPLPKQFFADSETLPALKLATPPDLAVPAEAYQEVMAEFNVRLDDEQGFVAPGDTHFAFVVPERALEDIESLKAAVGLILTPRLAACLLAVDFPNPVFSERRAALLGHVPLTGDAGTAAEDFADTLAASIRAAATDGSPEREFADLWESGEEGWRGACNQRLQAYYDALERRLAGDPRQAFHDWFRLAEATRRRAASAMPIFEFPLLLARSDAVDEPLAMRIDGTVGPPS